MTPTPHDALVRAIFGQPQYAAEELREVLPRELLGELVLETLAPVEGSFIDEALHESSADLLFTVGLRGGGSSFVYVLLEHQSTLDERMPLRLLRYQTRIWERHTAEHPGDPKLPPIVPLLLHHGPKPWPWQPSFASVVAVDERQRAAFGGKLLEFDFVLDDLAWQTDSEILGRASDAIVRLTLLSLRNGRSHPRLFELVAGAMRALQHELRGPSVVSAIARLARYALEVGDPEDRSEVMVSTADVLRAEGRRAALLDLLEVKFGRVDAALRSRVDAATNEQVIAWTRRVVVATSLEAVFAA